MVTVACMLDLTKGFDTVCHEILIHKMSSYGIRGQSLAWFKSYLSLRSQYVKFNNVTSSKESSPIGVPQGTILGPILFLLYVNDFAQCFKQCKCIMYADDTTVYYSCVFGKRNYRVLVRVSVCVCVCVCVCVFLHDNSKRNRSRNTKTEYIVVYENSSDEFDIELHRIKVKVTVGVQKFSPFTTIQTVRSYSSTLVQARNLILSIYLHLILIYKIYECRHA